ncbi:MAG: site-specific integrase [Candidatus Adiutrix sp.]|nr:site-specific integrase [Candidatus Adiutrix sp.]
MRKITPALVMKYLQKQCAARSGHAANKDKKNLATAWTWGERFIEGFPKSLNPFQAVMKFKEEHSRREMPTEADFWQVYNTATGQDKVMLLTCFHLAARRGEVFRLKWSDVDFANSKVRLGTCKTKDGSMRYDWLPMSQKLKSALSGWKDERPYKTEWVFTVLDDTPSPNHNPGEPFKARAHFMKTICKRAGVKPFGFHGIRHLTASIMFHKGQPLTNIQRFLRHTSPLTTVKYLRWLGCEAEYRDSVMPVFEDRQPELPGVLQFKKRDPQDGGQEGLSDTQSDTQNARYRGGVEANL